MGNSEAELLLKAKEMLDESNSMLERMASQTLEAEAILSTEEFYEILSIALSYEWQRKILFAKLAKGELSEKAAKFVSIVNILET